MSGFADVLFGQDYSKAEKHLYNAAYGNVASAHGASQIALYHALAAAKQGFGGADAAITQQGSVATQKLLDRETQNLAANRQSLLSRGLYGTTTLDAANRGTMLGTNQGLADLGAQLAQLRSNVKIGEGNAIAGAYSNIGANESQYANVLAQLGLGEASGIEFGRQGGYGEDIGRIIGAIIGSFA